MNAEYRGKEISIAVAFRSLDPSHKGYRSHFGYVREIAIGRGIKGALYSPQGVNGLNNYKDALQSFTADVY